MAKLPDERDLVLTYQVDGEDQVEVGQIYRLTDLLRQRACGADELSGVPTVYAPVGGELVKLAVQVETAPYNASHWAERKVRVTWPNGTQAVALYYVDGAS